jgi:hypothetical protein
LRAGQANGEFRLNVQVMTIAIRGAIEEYLANPNISAEVDLELHITELVTLFGSAISKIFMR